MNTIYNNSPQLAEKTWPYGARKTVEVINQTGKVVVAVDVNATSEAFVMVGSDHAPGVEIIAHRLYVMEFTKGGIRGGYWRILAEAQQPRVEQ